VDLDKSQMYYANPYNKSQLPQTDPHGALGTVHGVVHNAGRSV